MTAPLITELRAIFPKLNLTVQTDLPEAWLRSRLEGAFTLVRDTPDFGARMVDAVQIDLERTIADYTALHDRLAEVIRSEADRLRRLEVELVISNISYVALAAAAEAGIPAIGLSCFTWADILGGYQRQRPEVAPLVAEMNACYARADLMLRATPGMTMAGLDNVRLIGPMAARTPGRRQELVERLGAGQGERIGLVGFGGIGLPLSLEQWARLDGWLWLVAEPPPAGRPDMRLWSDSGLPFSHVLASADVVVTKPGYGTFTECAVNGIPVLTLPRSDWPETPYLMAWLENHGRVCTVSPETLFSPRLGSQLHELFSLPAKPLPEPAGVQDAVEAVLEVLHRRGRFRL